MKNISIIKEEKQSKLLILGLMIIFLLIVGIDLVSFLYKEFWLVKENNWIFIITIFLYCLIALIAVIRFYLKKGKEILTIKEEGFIDNVVFGFVPWSAVKSIKLYRYGFLKAFTGITVEISDVEKRIQELPRDLKSEVMFNYKQGKPLIKIEGFLTPSIEKIYDIFSFYIYDKQ